MKSDRHVKMARRLADCTPSYDAIHAALAPYARGERGPGRGRLANKACLLRAIWPAAPLCCALTPPGRPASRRGGPRRPARAASYPQVRGRAGRNIVSGQEGQSLVPVRPVRMFCIRNLWRSRPLQRRQSCILTRNFSEKPRDAVSWESVDSSNKSFAPAGRLGLSD